MAEAAVVYGLVAAAAAWTVWKLFLPRSLKARFSKRKPKGCGDGGCDNCGGD